MTTPGEGGPPDEPSDERPDDAPQVVLCSARGCRAAAVWVLEWSNPRIHGTDRLKAWAACEEHRDSLSEFLTLRGFLRSVVPLQGWRAPTDG